MTIIVPEWLVYIICVFFLITTIVEIIKLRLQVKIFKLDESIRELEDRL